MILHFVFAAEGAIGRLVCNRPHVPENAFTAYKMYGVPKFVLVGISISS